MRVHNYSSPRLKIFLLRKMLGFVRRGFSPLTSFLKIISIEFSLGKSVDHLYQGTFIDGGY